MATLSLMPTPDEPAEALVNLERRADGRLWLDIGGAPRPVRAVCCLPWSCPGRYVSLRDEEGDEVAFVPDPAVLAEDSRAALEEAVAEAGFVLRVEGIASVDEEIEIRVWKVRTSQGMRTFQTARDQWPRELPGGGFLIRDVAGDLYLTPEPEDMDDESRQFLWAFVD